MRTHFKKNSYSQQPVNVKEIWGINFFWVKDLKCSEKDIKKATEQAMHLDKQKNGQDHFKKAS